MKAHSSIHITPQVLKSALEEAALAYDVRPDAILTSARSRNIAHARQYAMWLLRERRRPDGRRYHGFVEIGRVLNRDHTTAIHAWRRVTERLGEGAE